MNKKHVSSVVAQMLKRTVIVAAIKCTFVDLSLTSFKAAPVLIVKHPGKAIGRRNELSKNCRLCINVQKEQYAGN